MLFKSQKTKQKFNPDYWRDHSANERTYLSWMRASIALMGFGLVILRLRTVSSSSLGLGWLLGFVCIFVISRTGLVVGFCLRYGGIINRCHRHAPIFSHPASDR